MDMETGGGLPKEEIEMASDVGRPVGYSNSRRLVLLLAAALALLLLLVSVLYVSDVAEHGGNLFFSTTNDLNVDNNRTNNPSVMSAFTRNKVIFGTVAYILILVGIAVAVIFHIISQRQAEQELMEEQNRQNRVEMEQRILERERIRREEERLLSPQYRVFSYIVGLVISGTACYFARSTELPASVRIFAILVLIGYLIRSVLLITGDDWILGVSLILCLIGFISINIHGWYNKWLVTLEVRVRTPLPDLDEVSDKIDRFSYSIVSFIHKITHQGNYDGFFGFIGVFLILLGTGVSTIPAYFY